MRDTVAPTTGAVRRFHPLEGAPARLICFPHAGGAAGFFRPLSAELRQRADVLCMQYPGHQDRYREPLLDDIAALADGAAEDLAPWRGEPLALFGHSMGALVAYEVARRLAADGAGPVRLFASGRPAPSVYREGHRHGKSDDELLADIRALDGTPPELLADEEVLQVVLPVLRSDYRAVANYRHPQGARLVCPVTVLTGDTDPRVTAEEARAWTRHTAADCEVRTFAGGHFFLAEHWPEIGRLVLDRLAAAPQPSGTGG
ncbi:thioesterase II family protein [Streptomyces sp. NBC_01477]|uniref:thioesterase II family protein n=1 Tax=Streptomyces sp. NBC_01477 TaxID=2976015 RepID=UPI002E3384E1|nr:alpha/beta fold hydrolase [Streptomyces sp. NBC_01477]